MKDSSTPKVAPLAFSPKDAAQRLSVPVRAIYSLLASGELKSLKLGRRRLIPDAECVRLLDRKLEEASR